MKRGLLASGAIVAVLAVLASVGLTQARVLKLGTFCDRVGLTQTFGLATPGSSGRPTPRSGACARSGGTSTAPGARISRPGPVVEGVVSRLQHVELRAGLQQAPLVRQIYDRSR